MTSTVIYKGNLRTEAIHTDSQTVINTDAPKDNNGEGAYFSPTDLVATALASCMCTIMGIAARTHGFTIDNTSCEVTKIMHANPRRIGEIKVNIHFPKDQHYSAHQKQIIEKAARTCPVFESLHPDCVKSVQFIYN